MSHQADRILTEQPLAGAIDEHEAMVVVEGEDGHVDLGHHRSEERRRFLRPEALHAKRLGERVDLQHHVRERIAAGRFPRTHREVAFAHRREKIRDRLQRTGHAVAHDHRERNPCADGEDEHGHAHERRVVAKPEQRDAQGDRRDRRRHRQQRDTPIVGEKRHLFRVTDVPCSVFRVPGSGFQVRVGVPVPVRVRCSTFGVPSACGLHTLDSRLTPRHRWNVEQRNSGTPNPEPRTLNPEP